MKDTNQSYLRGIIIGANKVSMQINAFLIVSKSSFSNNDSRSPIKRIDCS